MIGGTAGAVVETAIGDRSGQISRAMAGLGGVAGYGMVRGPVLVGENWYKAMQGDGVDGAEAQASGEAAGESDPTERFWEQVRQEAQRYEMDIQGPQGQRWGGQIGVDPTAESYLEPGPTAEDIVALRDPRNLDMHTG